MRLHLPKALLAAVLAACLAWPAGATDYTASCSANGTEIKCSSDGGTTTVDLTVPTAQDTITFDVSAGYLFNAKSGTAEEHTIAAKLVITQLNMTNGFSGGGTTAWYYFTGSVSGSGAITRSNAQESLGFSFSGDMSEYSGNITINGKSVTPVEGRDYDNILKLGAIQVGKEGAAGSITINENSKLQLAGTTIWGNVTSVKTEIGEGNTTFHGNLANTGTLTNNGSLTISGSYTGGTITQGDDASLTLASGSVVNMGGMTANFGTGRDSSTSGLQSYTASYTIADGGTTTGNDAVFRVRGEKFTGNLFNGVYTITESRYNILEGECKSIQAVESDIGDSADSYYINVIGSTTEGTADGTLTGVSDDTLTHGISGNGIIQVDASTSLSYAKLDDKGAEFTGSINVRGNLTGVSNSTLRHTIDGSGVIQVDAGDTLSYSTFTAKKASTFTGSINVLGELSRLSGNIATSIKGNGTLSMSAGTGEVTIAADRLTGFTGDLVVNSGRFNEASNGHLFSNVTVKNGGQFFINDGYNYTGDVSIAGTGWSKTGDLAWNGALRLGNNSTLSGKLTLTDDACIMAYYGANVTLAGEVDARDRTLTAKGTGTLNFGGNATIGSLITDSVSVAVNGGGTLSILKNSNLQKLYTNGAATITLGDGTSSSVITANRIELGDIDNSSKITTLTVSESAVLKITGNTNAGNNVDQDYKSLSALLGEWSASTTANINGTLLAENAKLLAGNTGFSLNIKSDALVVTKGIDRALALDSKNPTININIEGGSLILGDGGIAANGTNHSATSTGGVIGSYADTTTIASALSLTSGTTTIDTSKYNINANNTVTVPTTDATGSTITISGNISGDSGTKLEVTGEGEVILSGTDNRLKELMLSGGTTTISGTTTVDVTNSGNTVQGIVAADDDITLTVSSNGKLVHDGFEYAGTNLSGLKNGLSMWNGNTDRSVPYNVLVSGGSITQTDINPKTIYAKLSDVKLINTADKTSTLGVDAELSGAEIGGTLSINDKTTTTIKNSVTDSTDSSIAKLTGSGTLKTTSGTTTVTNASGFSGTLEATGGSMEASSAAASIAALKANGGNIDILRTSTLTVTDLVIGASNTVGVYEGTSAPTTPATGNEGTLTVTNLTANSGSILNANLVLNGANLTLNGSLTMGSSLTLNNVNLVNWNTLVGNQTGNSIVLFTSVDELTLGGTTYKATDLTEAVQVKAGTVFSNQGANAYNLSFGNDGVVSLMTQDTPEPTTATLSLLALMALAARRRRKA